MSAPQVVNTKDGTCWTRRTVTSDGLALYAPESVKTCPDFVMATLRELAEQGIVGSADVLPMPVGPEPRSRTMLDRARDALNARMTKDDLRLVLENTITCAAELERQRNAFRDQRNNVFATNEQLLARVEEVQAARLRAENETRTAQREAAALRARIAELEAERHTTNEALSDAVQELRTRETSPLTVYRASHDSIVMGLYTTAAAAREHCETEMRREYDESTKVSLWWREDEDTVDQPEDGEQELFVHATPAGMERGRTWGTGYVVTPLEVAAAYDEEADE